MTDVVKEEVAQELRDKFLELLDEVFGIDVVTDGMLPDIFRNLDAITSKTATAKLIREWKSNDYLYRFVSPTVVNWFSKERTSYLGDRKFRIGIHQKNETYCIWDETNDHVIGGFQSEDVAFMMIRYLEQNPHKSYAPLWEVRTGKIACDAATLCLKEIHDYHVYGDVVVEPSGAKTAVREVFFGSSSAIFPEDAMVVITNRQGYV